METQVLGLSVDSRDSLRAWADSLGGITYPLLSDFYPHGAVAQLYGVLRPEGFSERALFVIDKGGVIRYVDVHAISEQPDNEELFSQLAAMEPDLALAWQIAESADKQPGSTAPGPIGDVILYCTPWCPSCNAARVWLADRDVRYTEIDISKDREAAARVRSLANGHETTPTVDIRGEVVVGFDVARIARLLRVAP